MDRKCSSRDEACTFNLCIGVPFVSSFRASPFRFDFYFESRTEFWNSVEVFFGFNITRLKRV